MRGDFSTSGVAWWRLAERGGGGGGGRGREEPLPPLERRSSTSQKKEKKTHSKQSDDVYALSLGKGRLQHKHSRYHKHSAVSLLGSWQLHGAQGLRGRRPALKTLGANVGEEPARKTNTRRPLFQSTNQTSPFPAFHGASGRRDGRTATPGSLYYTFNEVL